MLPTPTTSLILLHTNNRPTFTTHHGPANQLILCEHPTSLLSFSLQEERKLSSFFNTLLHYITTAAAPPVHLCPLNNPSSSPPTPPPPLHTHSPPDLQSLLDCHLNLSLSLSLSPSLSIPLLLPPSLLSSSSPATIPVQDIGIFRAVVVLAYDAQIA